MTPIEAYRAELRRQLAALPRLQRSTIARVVAELEEARRQVLGEIAVMTNAGARASRERTLAEIERQLQGWSAAAARIGEDAASTAWRQGMAMVSAPLAAAGLGRGLGSQIDARALASIQSVLTSRISGASTEVIRQIDQVLLQVLIGTRPQSDAITRISELLGSTRRRAQTILFTELGRAHAMANHATMLEAAEQLPGLRKRWLRSGKTHPRPSHFRAHNQIVLAAQPFVIENVRLMHPRDPAAPAKHTINCGCMSVPVVDGSSFGASNTRFDNRDPTSEVVMVRRDETTPAELAMGVVGITGNASGGSDLLSSPVYAGLPEAVIAVVAEFERRHARSAIERLGYFSADGRIVDDVTGTRDAARLTIALDGNLGGILTHTHTMNSAPGYQDLLTAAAYQVTELRVVGPRDVFRVGPFDAQSLGLLLANEDDLRREFRRTFDRLSQRYPRIPADQIMRLAYNHHAIAVATRLGLTYRRFQHGY
jgi:hypothetical protein